MTRYHKLAAVLTALLAITIASLPAARRGVVWACIHSFHAVEQITHLRSISLDRLDPTCPQCM
jgi:hypothetical protein